MGHVLTGGAQLQRSVCCKAHKKGGFFSRARRSKKTKGDGGGEKDEHLLENILFFVESK